MSWAVSAICFWIDEDKPQTTQTKQRVALAHLRSRAAAAAALALLFKSSPNYYMMKMYQRPQSGCGSSSRPKGAKATGRSGLKARVCEVCGFILMCPKANCRQLPKWKNKRGTHNQKHRKTELIKTRMYEEIRSSLRKTSAFGNYLRIWISPECLNESVIR